MSTVNVVSPSSDEAGTAELQQLGVVRDRPAVGLLELVAVDVLHQAHVRLAAHRALVVEVDADVLRGPHELGVRVADVESRECPAPVVAQDRSAAAIGSLQNVVVGPNPRGKRVTTVTVFIPVHGTPVSASVIN